MCYLGIHIDCFHCHSRTTTDTDYLAWMNDIVVGMIVVVLEVSFGSAYGITVVMVRTDKVISVLNISLFTISNSYFLQVTCCDY